MKDFAEIGEFSKPKKANYEEILDEEEDNEETEEEF